MHTQLSHPQPTRRSATGRSSARSRSSAPARARLLARPDREVPFGINTTIGSGAMILTLLACALVPGRDGAVRLAVICAVLAWFAASTSDVTAVAAVLVVTCLVGDGFLVNHEGLLSWHGWPDVWRVAALGAAAATGLAMGRALAWRSERRRFAVVRRWS